MPHFIFIQQISILNILNMLYNLHFFSSKCRLFHNATLFGFCITHILNTGVLKFEKKSVAKRLTNHDVTSTAPADRHSSLEYTTHNSNAVHTSFKDCSASLRRLTVSKINVVIRRGRWEWLAHTAVYRQLHLLIRHEWQYRSILKHASFSLCVPLIK